MRMQTMLLGFLMAGLLLGGSMAPALAADGPKSARPAMEGQRGPWDFHPFMNLSPEKRSALIALFKEQRDKTHPLREQLWIKRTTLFALKDNPKTEPQQLTALVNEMAELRAKLRTERLAFEQKVQKDFGIDLPMGFHGMGKGWHGRGGGCGMMGGMGPGGGYGYGGMGHGGGLGHRGMGDYR